MNEENEKEHEPSWLSSCFAGCCLGAVGAPILFILLMVTLYFVAGDFDAEGVPFFLIMSVPCGAISGAVLWPTVARCIRIFIEEFNKDESQ